MLRGLVLLLMLSAFAVGPAKADEGQAKVDEGKAALIKDSLDALNSHFSHKEWKGVINLLGAAKAILIAPNFWSASLVVVGYEKGDALLLARHEEDWSDPVFVSLSQKSVGTQIGVKKSEVMMLVLTREAVDQIAQGLGRVGGTGGFALASLGVGVTGAGGISGGMQVLTVATSEGLSLGGGLGDVNVAPIDKFNSQAYGDVFDMKSVLDAKGGKLEGAAELRSRLSKASKDAWTQ